MIFDGFYNPENNEKVGAVTTRPAIASLSFSESVLKVSEDA